jgi:hypothetical protein
MESVAEVASDEDCVRVETAKRQMVIGELRDKPLAPARLLMSRDYAGT